MTFRLRMVMAVVAVAFAGMPGVVHGETTSARQQAFTLAGQLMSPYCPGLLLSSCQSQGAHELKGEITRRLEAGESQEGVVADLVQRFGPGIRGAPEMRGVGLVAWLGPAIAGSITVLLLGVVLRKVTRSGVEAGGHGDASLDGSPALLARVDQALLDLD